MKPSKLWVMRIAGFLAVVVAVGAISETLGLKYWMPRINDRSLNVFLYQKQRIEPDVLIVGSSQILSGLIPASLDAELSDRLGREVSAYTVAQLGAGCYANSMVLRDVLESNRPPEVVIFEASPSALSADHSNVPKALRYYASLPDLIRATPWLTSGDRLKGAAAGCFRGFANLALYAHHEAFPHGLSAGLDRLLGWRGRMYGATYDSPDRLSDLSSKQRKRLAKKVRRLARRLDMDGYRIGGPPEVGFHRSCRLAREHGIRLVMVNPPVTDEYRRLMYPRAVTDEYLRFMTEAEGSEGFEFVDLDRGTPRLTDADFMDLGHLNADGARKLSRYVAREVLLPVMADQEPR